LLEITRERHVSVGDQLWESFAAQARRLGLDTSQAVTSALRQWVVLAPDDDHCRDCGQPLCQVSHHLQWCEEEERGSRVSPDCPSRPFLAPAEVHQRGQVLGTLLVPGLQDLVRRGQVPHREEERRIFLTVHASVNTAMKLSP
jgi:hypothetical protein